MYDDQYFINELNGSLVPKITALEILLVDDDEVKAMAFFDFLSRRIKGT